MIDVRQMAGFTTASKAFLSGEIARWVDEEVCRLDVMFQATNSPSRCMPDSRRANRHARQQQIGRGTGAVQAGVGHVVLDSMTEIDRLDAVAAEAAASSPTS